LTERPPNPKPLVIYLDSADYSRFAGVLEGNGNVEDSQIFETLKEAKRTGKAIFVFL
jgi:hypothetical protein